MSHCKTYGSPHKMPPARNGLEALYSDVVQQLEQLQLQNLRKTMKKYLQSTEVKDWMRLKRRKSVQMIHPAPHKDHRIDDTMIQEQLNQRHSAPSHSVNLECQAFPKYRNQKVENIGNRNMRNLLDPSRRQERARESGPVAVEPSWIAAQSASSNRKVDRPFNEPENLPTLPQRNSELGRFRKSIEVTKTYKRSSRATTTVGCETLATTRRSLNNSTKCKPRSPQVLPPTKTECSSAFFHIRNLKCEFEGTTHSINKLETRPASMALRRELNCNTLIEEVKRQRALDAKLEVRKRERLNAQIVNAPMAIVILRSNKQPSISNRNRNKNEARTGALRNEVENLSRCSETPTSSCFQAKRFGLEEDEGCNGRTIPSYRIKSEQPNSRSMLISALAQKSRPLATESRTTAILQDALKALECAHRWNEWGARTLHQLARASKAAVERNHSLPGWPRINEAQKPKIFLPHDNDIVTSTRRGRVLESREEERVFIRDLVVVSGLTNGDWVEKHPLDAKHQHIVKRTYTRHKQQDFIVAGGDFFERFSAEQKNKKKLVDQHILCDFVEELLRHELVLQKCAPPGINLATLMHEHEHKGQALVQKLWNNLQTYPSPSYGICTAVELVLERDLKAQDPTWVEVAEVVRELEKMIYENLVQELLEELQQVVVLGDRVQNQSQGWHTYMHVKI